MRKYQRFRQTNRVTLVNRDSQKVLHPEVLKGSII